MPDYDEYAFRAAKRCTEVDLDTLSEWHDRLSVNLIGQYSLEYIDIWLPLIEKEIDKRESANNYPISDIASLIWDNRDSAA